MMNNIKPNEFKCLMLRYFLLFSIPFIIFAVFEHTANAKPGIGIIEGDEWSYFKGKQKPPRKWNHLGFDDATWQRGKSRFSYGIDYGIDRTGGTVISDMRGNYSTLYVRREFTVNLSKINRIDLSVICNGSFIAYLNGIEVARNKTRFTEPINISGFIDELFPGKNVLAIECSNDDINSSSFEFLPLFKIVEK